VHEPDPLTIPESTQSIDDTSTLISTVGFEPDTITSHPQPTTTFENPSTTFSYNLSDNYSVETNAMYIVIGVSTLVAIILIILLCRKMIRTWGRVPVSSTDDVNLVHYSVPTNADDAV
jgi:hypothetical protein